MYDKNNLKSGTILFRVSNDNSDFTKAVSDSANIIKKNQKTFLSGLPIDHCALVVENNKIMEATLEGGVIITDIENFLNNSVITIIANVLDKKVEKQAVKNAMKFLGKSYNYTFEPDNNSIYCSQLITESFLNADGSRYFSLHKMNFLDRNGKFLPYWVEYYKKYKKNIPQDVYGSHPKQLLLQVKLFDSIVRIK